MPQLLHESFLSEQQFFDLATSAQSEFPRSDLPREAAESRPTIQFNSKTPRELNHWTKRLRDPLGDALARIKSGNHARAQEAPPAPEPETRTTSSKQAATAIASIEVQFPITVPMSLSQDVAGDHDTAAKAGNRRKFPRRQSECSVAIVPRSETVGLTPRQIDCLLESEPTIGRLQDLSQIGICLLHSSDIAADSEVLLRIVNDKLGRQIDVSARVIRCLSVRHGVFSIHCRTLRDFTLDELQDLGQPLLQPLHSGISVR